MATREERLQVLNIIERGELTARQGVDLLLALDGRLPLDASAAQSGESSLVVQAAPATSPSDPSIPATTDHLEDLSAPRQWQVWWLFPLLLGTGLTLLSAWWMYLAFRAGGLNFLFFCAWPALLCGIALTALAAQSRTIPWLHVRIQEASGAWPARFAISLPLPLGPVAWILRNFGELVPAMQGVPVDDLFAAVQTAVEERTPFFLQVDGDGGEKVQVYVG